MTVSSFSFASRVIKIIVITQNSGLNNKSGNQNNSAADRKAHKIHHKANSDFNRKDAENLTALTKI